MENEIKKTMTQEEKMHKYYNQMVELLEAHTEFRESEDIKIILKQTIKAAEHLLEKQSSI
jgi:hypothetical protein